jgi:Ran GTPase-activating protein (RanGAP) involved in mRNA processing and transport
MCAKSLERFVIADNGINQSEGVMNAIELAWTKNQKLKRYDLRHNNITDDGVDRLCEIL